MADKLNFNRALFLNQQAEWHTQGCLDNSKALSKIQKLGGGPIPDIFHPFPKIVGIILPLISLWNYPTHKN